MQKATLEALLVLEQLKKLDCLDGLKVIACFMVFNFHFVNLFYPGEYCLFP